MASTIKSMEVESSSGSLGLLDTVSTSYRNETNQTMIHHEFANENHSEYYNETGSIHGYDNYLFGNYSKTGYEGIKFANKFKFYSLPIIFFVGIISNFLCLVVILSSKLKKNTTGVYMVGLAMADLIYLFSELMIWINSDTFGQRLVDKNQDLCKSVFLIHYGSMIWSTFLTIAITVERFLVISFPLKVKKMLTLKVSSIVVIVSGVLSFCLNFYGAVTMGHHNDPGITVCDVLPDYAALYWLMVVIVVVGIGQFLANILIFTFSVLIIYKLLKARKKRNSMTTQDNNQQNREIHVTAMVLSVAVLFLVCKTPYGVAWNVGFFSYHSTDISDADDYKFNQIHIIRIYLDNLNVLNHGINFLLYVIFGSNFREALLNVLCCARRKRSEANGPAMTRRMTTSTVAVESINT